MSKLKQLFSEIKNMVQKFEDPAPEAPKPYKLEDGTEVMIDKLEVGGKVMIGENPAPAGTHKLEDGSSIVVDEAGLITEVIAAAAPAQAPEAASANPPAAFSVEFTEDGLQKAFESFATGTMEEQVANLQTMCKALMEYCYGWKINEAKRKADEDAAIKVYQDSLAPVAEQVQQQKEVMGKILELVEAFIAEPTEQPTEQKSRFSFSKVATQQKSQNKFKDHLAQLQASNKN